MFDAVGDAWFVLVDGTTWIGFREGDARNFDPGGSFHGCDSDGFRELGDYILCDDGHARERFSFVDEPGAPPSTTRQPAPRPASGDSIIVFGEDGFARLYAADHDSRRSDDCGHWPGGGRAARGTPQPGASGTAHAVAVKEDLRRVQFNSARELALLVQTPSRRCSRMASRHVSCSSSDSRISTQMNSARRG